MLSLSFDWLIDCIIYQSLHFTRVKEQLDV